MKRKPKRQRIAQKPNPILAAIDWSLKGRRYTAIMDGDWHTLPRETQLDIIREFFSPETIYEVGALVLGSILSGGKREAERMSKTVRDAIKAGDHLFNRDRELKLLRPALRYRLCNWDVLLFKNRGNSQRAVDELRKGIEQHCNNGKKLEQHQWSRLRRALALPAKLTFAAGKTKVGTIGELIDFAPPFSNSDTKRSQKLS
jgi:hypothetical protein